MNAELFFCEVNAKPIMRDFEIISRSKFQARKHEFNNLANFANSRVAERVAPQASLAPSQAPLAKGALSERLVPPFLQSVSLSHKAFHFCKNAITAATCATLSARNELIRTCELIARPPLSLHHVDHAPTSGHWTCWRYR